MLETTQAFDLMIQHCNQLPVAPSFRNDLLTIINFLRKESLDDRDRHSRRIAIKEAWYSLATKAKGTQFLESFSKNKQAWARIHDFLELSDLSSSFKPQKPEHDFDKWDVDKILKHLLARVQITAMDKKDQLILRLVLHCLILEAERPRTRRNQNFIKEIWKAAWPILAEHKLLDIYRQSNLPKQKIAFFIKGTF